MSPVFQSIVFGQPMQGGMAAFVQMGMGAALLTKSEKMNKTSSIKSICEDISNPSNSDELTIKLLSKFLRYSNNINM